METVYHNGTGLLRKNCCTDLLRILPQDRPKRMFVTVLGDPRVLFRYNSGLMGFINSTIVILRLISI
jgi:hypothetical protein